MGKAVLAFVLSAGLGIWFSFFNQGIGIVICISIIGAFLIYQNENKGEYFCKKGFSKRIKGKSPVHIYLEVTDLCFCLRQVVGGDQVGWMHILGTVPFAACVLFNYHIIQPAMIANRR